MSKKLLKVKDKDGNIELIEGLKTILHSNYENLFIFDGDCFINKKTKNFIETFYDSYRYTYIAKVIDNKFVDMDGDFFDDNCKLMYNLDIKKYFKNMEYIGNVYVDGLEGVVQKYLEFGGLNEIS
jgi:hypothetical protein